MYDSGSDDDVPLAAKTNGSLSARVVSKATDRALDRAVDKDLPKNQRDRAGLSIRNGPVEPMDVDPPTTNGAAKRKSRNSTSSQVNYKDDDSDSDGAPLAKRPRKIKAESDDSDDEPLAKKNPVLPPAYNESGLMDSSDDDTPLGTKLANKKRSIEKAATKEAKVINAKAKKPTPRKAVKEEQPDGARPSKGRGTKPQPNGTVKKVNGVKKEESDSDEPIAKKKQKTATKGKGKSAATTAKKGKKQESEEPAEGDEEEGEYAWWNQQPNDDDSVKWNTLEHNGVMFPPPYEPLPKTVKLVYDGVRVNLQQDAEEVAGFYGAMLNSEHCEKPVFNKNFFEDFREVLKATGGATDADTGKKVDIKHFEKLNFEEIYTYYKDKNEAKKARPAAEKKAEKAEKDEIERPYQYCKWDGRKEKVGNFRIEPPGLFRGRGEHPKTGKLKKRVMPEQVTINIGKDAPVPKAPEGHKWKAVQHDNTCTWLAMWKENINGNTKYVMLAANSAIKGQSDFKKFEKARELKQYIDTIRADYTRDLKSELMADRQRATAVYLIDKFALRAGNEKDTENEAETVGCCSLKYEHVTLKDTADEPNTVIFDFLGKDSIRFHQSFQVDPQVFKNLKLFKKAPKSDGDDIFDRLNTSQLNKYLSSYMKGLTAKVFRTYNASWTMQVLLNKLKVPKNASVVDKVKLYNDCNREVAILCNHKRSVGAGHEVQMGKIEDKIKGFMYEIWRNKQQMLSLDPKLKKKKGAAYFALPEDLSESWILEHQASLVEKKRSGITKKFQKDNEKLVANKEKPMPEKKLKELLAEADDLASQYQRENKTKKVEPEGKSPSVEKLEANIAKLEQRVHAAEVLAADRDGNKEVALGTSKINYIDPRLSVVFSKKFDVPLERLFSKTLRDKFNWAIKTVEDDVDWQF